MSRTKNKENTNKVKNEIVNTAEKLFAKKGYDKISLNEIIKHSKIAKGTFYHYFESKEELLQAIINKKTIY